MRDWMNWPASNNIEDRRPATAKQTQYPYSFWGSHGALMDTSRVRVPIAGEYRLPQGYGMPPSDRSQVLPPPGGINPNITAHESMGWVGRTNPQGPPMPAPPLKPWF